MGLAEKVERGVDSKAKPVEWEQIYNLARHTQRQNALRDSLGKAIGNQTSAPLDRSGHTLAQTKPSQVEPDSDYWIRPSLDRLSG